jgi:hypothetical protein
MSTSQNEKFDFKCQPPKMRSLTSMSTSQNEKFDFKCQFSKMAYKILSYPKQKHNWKGLNWFKSFIFIFKTRLQKQMFCLQVSTNTMKTYSYKLLSENHSKDFIKEIWQKHKPSPSLTYQTKRHFFLSHIKSEKKRD